MLRIVEFCEIDVICCGTSLYIPGIAQLMRAYYVGNVIVAGSNGETRVWTSGEHANRFEALRVGSNQLLKGGFIPERAHRGIVTMA